MNQLLAYLSGLATLPALFLLWALIAWVFEQFTSTSKGWRCHFCNRRWGFQGDGSVVGVARWRSRWHFRTAHPGMRGRELVAIWRGWDRHTDWPLFDRLVRTYPTPPITAVDVLARIPFLGSLAYDVAHLHGKKTAHA